MSKRRSRTGRSFSVAELSALQAPPSHRRVSDNDALFSSADLFDSMSTSNSVSPIAKPEPSHFSKPVIDSSVFQDYLTQDKNVRASSAVAAIKEITEFGRGLNFTLILLSNKRAEAQRSLDAISTFIRENKDYDSYLLRSQLQKSIGIRETILAHCSAEINKLRKTLTRMEQFINLIQNSQTTYLVFTQKFLNNTYVPSQPNPYIEYLMDHMPLVVFPDINKCNKNDVFHQASTKEGQILERSKKKYRELKPDDASFIIDALAKNGYEREEVEEIFFEEVWKIQDYPWMSSQIYILPDVSNIIPKVFNPPFIPDKYAYMTFGELAKTDWPLFHPVELLKTIIFEVNPFKIGRTFWMVIDMTSLIVQGLYPDEKELVLDFDQLFTLLIVEVLATMLSNITLPMIYSSIFRESLTSEPKIMYAMGHLDGLATHLHTLDFKDLLKKSTELATQYSKTVIDDDPLGVIQ